MTRKRRLGLLGLLVVSASAVDAQRPPTPVASVEGVTSYRLDNGMQVLLVPDPSRPLLTVNVTYFVGSRHEGYGESGMAHLLEHLVFKGTPRHPDIPAELSARGASPNGTTWPDRTSYHETFPATEENLRWALAFEADRMVNSFVSAEGLAAEMPVVRNEFEAGENDAVGILRQRVFAAAFPWHNYGRPTIGTTSDIEQVSIERLRAFYQKYYQPDNAVLVIAGAFDPAVALQVVTRTFGAIPRPSRSGAAQLWPTHTREPIQDGERGVVLRRPGDAEAVILGWHLPGAAHPDMAAIEVLAQVLGAPGTGRLFTSVIGPGIGANVTANSYRLREPGMLFAQAVLRRGDPAESARDAMLNAVARLWAIAPPSPAEVERGKAVVLQAIAAELLDPVAGSMRLAEWAAVGDWRLLYLHRDRLRAVTPADVQRVAVAYLKPSNLTVGILKPEARSQRVDLSDVGEVAAMVEGYRGDSVAVPVEAWDPSVEGVEERLISVTLPNGVRLAMLPRRTRGGMVTARFAFPFGTAEDLAGMGAVPEVTGQLLMRGTVTRDRQELGDAITRLQAEIGVGGSATGAFGAVKAGRAQFPEALRLAIEVLRRPRFDAREFEVLREAQLALLDQQRSNPQAIALRTMQRHLSPWAPGDVQYTASDPERRAQLAAVTLEAVQGFHARYYGASRGAVVIVGDFDPDSVHALVLRELAGWESLAPYQRIAVPWQAHTPLDTTIAIAEKANALLMVGRNIPVDEGHPDYPALVLANYLLGGGFLNSRLADRLRHRDGLSYGVQSFFSASPLDATATWIGMIIHAPASLAAVRVALDEELERARRDGFAAAEFDAARSGWLESRKLARANDVALAGRLVERLGLGRSLADDAALERHVAALKPREVQDVIGRYLRPEMLAVVKVGDYDEDR